MANKKDSEIEVVSVQRITDIANGKIVLQITFGKPVAITPEIRARISEDDPKREGYTEVYSDTIQLMLPIGDSDKFVLGSTWKKTVLPDGTIKIERRK
jgi:hypothetical protein